jgi:hypothetical protein
VRVLYCQCFKRHTTYSVGAEEEDEGLLFENQVAGIDDGLEFTFPPPNNDGLRDERESEDGDSDSRDEQQYDDDDDDDVPLIRDV